MKSLASWSISLHIILRKHSFFRRRGRAGGIHMDYHIQINNPPSLKKNKYFDPSLDCCSISSVTEQWIY
jgi:hypothetical protein